MNSILKANLMFCSASTKFLVRLYQLSRFKFRLTQAVLKYLNIAMLPGQKIHFQSQLDTQLLQNISTSWSSHLTDKPDLLRQLLCLLWSRSAFSLLLRSASVSGTWCVVTQATCEARLKRTPSLAELGTSWTAEILNPTVTSLALSPALNGPALATGPALSWDLGPGAWEPGTSCSANSQMSQSSLIGHQHPDTQKLSIEQLTISLVQQMSPSSTSHPDPRCKI